MILEKQVTSLELSRRLEKLGVKQESAFFWAVDELGGEETTLQYVGGAPMDKVYSCDFVSAFTVAELGEKMREVKRGDFLKAYCEVMDLSIEDTNSYMRADFGHNLMTNPDLGAKMLVYLIENNLMTV